MAAGGLEMGLGAGGSMKQDIYPDRHGLDTWDQDNHARVFVHLCNSHLWREITGEAPPETPVSAKTYTDHGYPWFDIYDEDKGDIKPSGDARRRQVRQGDGQAEGLRPAAGRRNRSTSPAAR